LFHVQLGPLEFFRSRGTFAVAVAVGLVVAAVGLVVAVEVADFSCIMFQF
jgi:hypothetical protein